ncbi:MAG TPA: SH3 domain-containing protein [Candidatus Limnocylindrales bacterium]|nr:SH3 domain-containing protein [Candidatus Limnocylindrales bacterium]
MLSVGGNRSRTRRLATAPLAALWAALLIVLGLVVPVLAVEGPTKLFDPSVSPTSGLPTTTIHFAVSYRNREGSPVDHVNVIVDGTAHRMTDDGSTDWKHGVRHTWSTTLPVGVHSVSFEAADTRRFSDTIDGDTVTITAPPTPSPTPKPTPTPTPAPTPKNDPTPTPRPTTPAPTARPASSHTPSPAPTTDGGSGTTPTPPAGGDGGSTGGGTGGTTIPGGSDGPSTAGPGGPGGPSGGSAWSAGSGGSGGGTTSTPTSSGDATGAGGDPSGATGSTGGDTSAASGGGGTLTSGPGWGSLASALQILGISKPPAIGSLPMIVGLTGAMTMAFAFAIFGKKRRDEQPPAPDEVLQASAARGHGEVPGGSVVRTPAFGMPIDAEAGVPRWRRPSLLEARKADPARYVATQRLSFDGGAVRADDEHERRIIRYRVVRLLDAPDELRSAEIGQLDQGDEVQLLERSGAYWLVLCPDGRQGWLHKMTLGEIVTDSAAASPWGTEVDSDVLSAFLQARARA